MVLTFALGPRVRVVRIVALGERRGPAPEARTLYDEIEGAAEMPRERTE
jgi:ribosome-associated heat shock protein Hsp15